ncbi:MAG: Xaa-Pro peptidase family protein [Gemmatimonadales bacterium]|nr:Xaa-Pro peptidase family protein [Gemmatimonadales bacterium]
MGPDRRPDRLAALRARVEAAGLDALLVTHLPNIRYLTGFSGTAGLLLVGPGRAVLITDFRYESQAAQEVHREVVVEIERVNVWSRLKQVLQRAHHAVLGYEQDHLVVREATRLSEASPGRLEPCSDLVEGLRLVKTPDEVARIREAAILAQGALDAILPGIHPGRTEVAIAADLEAALRQRGSEWHPFPTIVASGPRSALPHARTSDRVVGPGELLLIDFGAQVQGYCADLSRTFVVGGRADSRQREVYELVRVAQLRARTAIRAGQTGREADALARDLIAQGGHGADFGHSLGHGLGLEVHEAPRLSPTSDLPIPGGVVVTIEPGIYLPGWGGVRLEDDVHLAPAGPDLLSDGRTEMVELV